MRNIQSTNSGHLASRCVPRPPRWSIVLTWTPALPHLPPPPGNTTVLWGAPSVIPCPRFPRIAHPYSCFKLIVLGRWDTPHTCRLGRCNSVPTSKHRLGWLPLLRLTPSLHGGTQAASPGSLQAHQCSMPPYSHIEQNSSPVSGSQAQLARS